MRISKYFLFILFFSLLYSCTFSGLERPCTIGEGPFHITVLTPEGEPADSVQIEVTNKETGEKYDPCKEFDDDYCDQHSSLGIYVIFVDALEEDVNIEGRKVSVEVEGRKENLGFSQEFTFEYDGCNFFKAAGPDTVSLKPR